MSTPDYLHDCLALFPEVTRHRYGKVQRPDEVERRVAGMLKDGRDLWEIIRDIHDNDAFDAEMMFGFLPDQIEAKLKKTTWHSQWKTLPEEQLVRQLHGVFRQIEPVAVVLRFIDPNRYGIFSSPVATILGVRPRRRPTAAYEAYLKSLCEVRDERGFDRTADVDMALWALQVGVVESHLPEEQRRGLKESYERDLPLRQIATRNLTSQLLSENTKLTVAEYLLGQKEEIALAGQIAGIEFEQVVGKHVRSVGSARQDENLYSLINRVEPPDLRPDLHRARNIRNDAIHEPAKVTKEDVEFLIEMAREVERRAR